jgi:hypothetical protein
MCGDRRLFPRFRESAEDPVNIRRFAEAGEIDVIDRSAAHHDDALSPAGHARRGGGLRVRLVLLSDSSLTDPSRSLL